MDLDQRERMEEIYAATPPDAIPWNRDSMPDVLDQLISSGTVKPCRILDIGCGTGNQAIRLSALGFEVTGIDVSPSAIRIARDRMKRKPGSRNLNGNHELKMKAPLYSNVEEVSEKIGPCRFEVADMLDAPERLCELLGTFEFSYGHEVLHHIFPEERERYVRNVNSLLETGGKHLSVSFSEEDDQFPGEGNVRTTRLRTRLYLSGEKEIGELFGRQFQVLDLGTITVPGNRGDHRAVYCFMQK